MGRPINKRHFGTPDANNQLKVQFHNGTSSVPGYIVKQKGSLRFLCKDANGDTAICRLVDKDAGDLLEGEMSITAVNDAGDSIRVVKITGRKITANDGDSYPWNFSTSNSDGAVQVEEAGTDDQLTGSTDLEGDEV